MEDLTVPVSNTDYTAIIIGVVVGVVVIVGIVVTIVICQKKKNKLYGNNTYQSSQTQTNTL